MISIIKSTSESAVLFNSQKEFGQRLIFVSKPENDFKQKDCNANNTAQIAALFVCKEW